MCSCLIKKDFVCLCVGDVSETRDKENGNTATASSPPFYPHHWPMDFMQLSCPPDQDDGPAAHFPLVTHMRFLMSTT